MIYIYQRDIVGGIYDIDAGSLEVKIHNSELPGSSVSCLKETCSISFLEPLSEPQKTELDVIVVLEKADIAIRKTSKIQAVRTKTKEGLALGLPFDSHMFSCSPEAQTHWIALTMAKDSLPYPYAVPTGFDDVYSFQDANAIASFFAVGIGFVQYWEQSDEQLRIAINACTTIEQLNAIIDSRSYPPA